MPQELTTKNTVLKGGKVLPKENTTIYGTGSNKFMPTGKKFVVHRIQAEKLISAGSATLDAPEESEESSKTKKGGKGDEK